MPLKAGECADFGWQGGELVARQVQALKAGESADFGRRAVIGCAQVQALQGW
jgi:hypothetical protein